ncbi:THO complex, subunit THOC1 [Geopyxis carbonaria]|nr:THO complex, subunit THOC1 [Geopyxis carbonaria]
MDVALAPTSDMKTPQGLGILIREALASIKKSSLEPSLTEADFDPELLEKIKPTVNDDNYKNLIDTTLKLILYDFATSESFDDDGRILAIGNLLDFALICSENRTADINLPFNLLEDLFDTQTVPMCGLLFNHPESRVDRLRKILSDGKGGGLPLLRTCNELLRRLSKAEDTIFCGRILIFLSKSFPIAERSAVNLRGEFNIDNVTIFDDVPDDTPPKDDSMEIDEKEAGEAQEEKDKENGPKSDESLKGGKSSIVHLDQNKRRKVEQQLSPNKLYTVFWSLQHDFSDPTRLFVPENFAKFKEALAATMIKFREADKESYKSSGGSGKTDHGPKKHDDKKIGGPVAGEKRKREDDSHGESSFNPKFLTSRELFELEISDLTFRRNVLVQAMILLDFLLGLTPAAKEKWKDLQTPNKSVQYAFTLEPEDEEWVMKTKSQITSSLQPDQLGKLFVRLINTVIAREQNWVHWKAEGCHKFDMAPLEPAEIVATKNKASEHCKPPRPFPNTMGTPTLSKIWQDTGKDLQIEDLMDEGRRRIPTVDDFRKGLEKDKEDLKDAMFPADEEVIKNAMQTKTWKALRLASHHRFHLFNKFEDKPDVSRNDLQMLAELEEKADEELKTKASQQAQVVDATA